MDRETALQQLQDMRREILAIYTEMDNCRKIQRRVEALQKEKEQPAPPAAVPLKPENTADKLQKTLEQQNRQRHASNTKPALLIKLVNAALQVILCVLLALDLFGQKGIIIQEAMLAQITQFGSSNAAMLFAAQLILSLLVVLAPLCWSFFTRRRVLFGILFGLVAIFYFYIMGTMVKAWLYVILFAVSVGLLLAAFAVLRSVRSRMVSSPTLTAAQNSRCRPPVRPTNAPRPRTPRLAPPPAKRVRPSTSAVCRKLIRSFRPMRRSSVPAASALTSTWSVWPPWTACARRTKTSKPWSC